MSFTGDHDADMAPNWQIDDDVVEAIIRNEAVGDTFAPLALFARSVQAAGEEPAPRASGELAELLLEGLQQPHPPGLRPVVVASSATRGAKATGPARRRNSKRRSRVSLGIAAVGAKVAGLSIPAKVAAATGALAVGGLTSGATGLAPAAVTTPVQDGISAVSPLDLGNSDDTDADVNVGNTANVGADASTNGADAGAGASTEDVTGTATGAVDDAVGTATGAVGGVAGQATGTATGAVEDVTGTVEDVPVAGEVVDELPEVPVETPALPLPGVPAVPDAEAGAGAEATP
jgi:hypothetical protein